MVNYNNLEPVHILKMIVISGRGLKLFHGKSNIDKVAGKYIWQRAQKGSVITILRGQTFVKNIKTGNVSKFSLNTVYRYHSWLQYSQREREHSSLFKTLKFVFVTTMRRNIVYCVFEGFWWQFVQGLDINEIHRKRYRDALELISHECLQDDDRVMQSLNNYRQTFDD